MRVFGSETHQLGFSCCLPVKSVLTIGLPGGVVSVAFRLKSELFGCSALSVALARTLPSGIGTVGVM